MSEPWAFTDDQLHLLVASGADEDSIAYMLAARKEKYDTAIAERGPEAERHFYNKYGFDHKCRCIDDLFAGNVVEIPVCTLEMGDEALQHLTKVLMERDMLRDQVLDMGGDPIA